MGFVVEKNNLREAESNLYRMKKHWPLLQLTTGQTATTPAMPTARSSREGVRAVLPFHVLKPPVLLRGLWLPDQKSGMKVVCRQSHLLQRLPILRKVLWGLWRSARNS